jgi:plasmid stability protein
MANLTIRNVDDEVVEALKAKAKAHNRSLEAEIRQILVDQVRRPAWRGAELRALAEKIAAMTPDVPQTDSVELLREDRDR